MIRTILLRLCLSAALTSAVACTAVPGSNISGQVFTRSVLPAFDNAQIEASLVQITPSLISSLDQFSVADDSLKVWSEEHSIDYEYQVGVGDVLSIVVWDHPELTAPFGSFNNVQDQGNVVREDGTIFYPFVGQLKVAGRTARAIQEDLAVKLADYIESPQLDVRVVNYRSQRFFVTGFVSKPGTYPITDVPIRVVEALGIVGGLLPDADLYDVTLSRDKESFNIPLYDVLYEGDLSGNALLQHGDILHIAPVELRRVFVMGEVQKPLTLPMTNRALTLTQALGEAGGIQEARADGRGIYVIRKSEFEGVIDVYQLDVSEAWAFALGDEFLLQPRDVVYVSAAPISRWNRWVSNVLPSLQGLFNLDRVTN